MLKLFASIKVRVFLTSWILFSLHFATNVVREHYPAFSLVDNGTFKVDEYEGFHSDIFRHTDGHCYIGNQVAASVLAAIPLWFCDPLLDRLEARDRARLADAPPPPDYRTEHGNARAFYLKVRERGLALRFGAATAVTSVFLAAVTAWFLVAFLSLLETRGVPRNRAVILTFLLGFGTPIFYRTASLNHNHFVLFAVFACFVLIWNPKRPDAPLSLCRRLAAGACGGATLALDYAGVVPLLVFFAYLILKEVRTEGWRSALLRSGAYVLGSVPPVLFLLYSQWAMYGNPFLPGQFWMPDVNFTERGWRGLSMPTFEVFWRNLFDFNWGIFAFGPVLMLGLVPAALLRGDLIVGRRARRASGAFVASFMIFCAANQYSLMQWNTGFRYMLPLVPFLFLTACDPLSRMPRWLLAVVAAPAVLHAWVMTMVRFTPVDFDDTRTAVGEDWRRFLAEGVQFRWLNALRETSFSESGVIGWSGLPYAILVAVGAGLWFIWWAGRRACRA